MSSKITVTFPDKLFDRLRSEAGIANLPFNRHVIQILERKKVIVISDFQEVCEHLAIIRILLEKIADNNKNLQLRLEVSHLCQYVELFLASIIKHIS